MRSGPRGWQGRSSNYPGWLSREINIRKKSGFVEFEYGFSVEKFFADMIEGVSWHKVGIAIDDHGLSPPAIFYHARAKENNLEVSTITPSGSHPITIIARTFVW